MDIWNIVKNAYDEIRGSNLIIKYDDLRKSCMKSLNLSNTDEFDELFTKLMKNKWQSINLHGTLVGEYDKHVNFKYRGRMYPFLSLTLVR